MPLGPVTPLNRGGIKSPLRTTDNSDIHLTLNYELRGTDRVLFPSTGALTWGKCPRSRHIFADSTFTTFILHHQAFHPFCRFLQHEVKRD